MELQGQSKTVFRVCLITLLCIQYVAAQPYCTKPTNVNNTNDPPFPQVPNSFQTRIEATIIDKNYTISGEEYFDYASNQASITLLKFGDVYKLIFDYPNEQLFYVQPDNSCVTKNLTQDDNNYLFGDNFKNGPPHVFTTSGVLHFAKTYGEEYKGRETIRGVNVDHWQTCMYWPLEAANFTLDYYFSVPEWLTPAGMSQIPVRAVVEGVVTKSGTTHHMKHYYDYTDFRAAVYADHTVFETPSGVVCPGRKQTRAVPSIGKAFSYREEILQGNQVQEVDDNNKGDDVVINPVLQDDLRAEFISNPKILTSDRCVAAIKQGVQIPFQTVSQNGTQTQFEDAAIILAVRPQITPNGSVIMDLFITKDTPGVPTQDGLTINTRQITTSVQIEDGETVVLGGVFEGNTRHDVNSVPWFADLPLVGWMFRKTIEEDFKKELLIFITPKIIKDSMKMR